MERSSGTRSVLVSVRKTLLLTSGTRAKVEIPALLHIVTYGYIKVVLVDNIIGDNRNKISA